MFFLIANLIMEKHYPEFITQLVVGSICYVFVYFILKDTINVEEYSSYFIFLAIIDTAYLVYQKKFNTVPQEINEYPIQTVQESTIRGTTQTGSNESTEASDSSIKLASELSNCANNSQYNSAESSNHLFSIESEKS